MTLHGRVKNGVVVFQNGESPLTDGMEVLVTPVAGARCSGAAIVAALENAPKVPAEWVDELEQLIAEGQPAPAPPELFDDETGGKERR